MEANWVEQRRIAGRYAHGRKESRAMDRLARFAEARALPGDVVTDGRSFATEGVEECADGYNYATWGALAGQIPSDIAARVCSHLAEAHRLLDAHR